MFLGLKVFVPKAATRSLDLLRNRENTVQSAPDMASEAKPGRTLLAVHIPWGKMSASIPEPPVVDETPVVDAGEDLRFDRVGIILAEVLCHVFVFDLNAPQTSHGVYSMISPGNEMNQLEQVLLVLRIKFNIPGGPSQFEATCTDLHFLQFGGMKSAFHCDGVAVTHKPHVPIDIACKS